MLSIEFLNLAQNELDDTFMYYELTLRTPQQK